MVHKNEEKTEQNPVSFHRLTIKERGLRPNGYFPLMRQPLSFTYYITAESESSYSAVSIVHLVYSMCQIFSSSSPVLFLVPGACAAGTQTAPCRTNKNASSPSTYASFARSRDTKSADAYSDKHAWQSSSCARQTHARGNPAFSPCAFVPSGSYFSVIFAILAAGKRCA